MYTYNCDTALRLYSSSVQYKEAVSAAFHLKVLYELALKCIIGKYICLCEQMCIYCLCNYVNSLVYPRRYFVLYQNDCHAYARLVYVCQ